ncbi:MAG TPA: DNA translocase FtsK 4TM domain-containing protein, partial [Segetibacter sp.]
MANRIKKKTVAPPNPDILSPDKQEAVTVKEIVKDERTYKIAGTISLLVSLFLFVALTSYAFTWVNDQDIVHQFGVKIFSVEDVHVSNLLGVLGAYTAHAFIYKGFGIASYLFCSFFFILGINLLFAKKVFSLKRNLKYVLAGLVVISITLSFVLRNSQFSFGGAFGELITDWLIKWIGVVGTGALLLVTGFSYFVWRVNPTFTWPERKPEDKPVAKPQPDQSLVAEEEEEALVQADGALSINDLYNENGAKLYVEKDVVPSNNKLKKEGKGVVVMMPLQDDVMAEYPLHDLKMVEKEEDQTAPITVEEELEEDETVAALEEEYPLYKLEVKDAQEDEMEPETEIEIPVASPPIQKVFVPQKVEITDDFELEIKDFEEEDEEEEIVIRPSAKDVKLSPYDPMLDLRDYKYPSLELLETHGSEKIVHDPIELENNKNQIISTLKNYDIAIQRIAATVG